MQLGARSSTSFQSASRGRTEPTRVNPTICDSSARGAATHDWKSGDGVRLLPGVSSPFRAQGIIRCLGALITSREQPSRPRNPPVIIPDSSQKEGLSARPRVLSGLTTHSLDVFFNCKVGTGKTTSA
jgi:hypothetical protein